MLRTKPALLLSGLVVLSLACKAKVEVSVGGEAATVKMGTFTCTELKDDACVNPVDHFSAAVPVVHMAHNTKDIPKKGDVYTMQWIAEDVGSAAPANTVIAILNKEVTEVVDTASSTYFVGTQLTKPTAGWPLGKYRVEVKLGDKLVTSARFTIDE